MEHFMPTAHKQPTIQHENANIFILPPKMGTKKVSNCAENGLLSMKNDNNLAPIILLPY